MREDVQHVARGGVNDGQPVYLVSDEGLDGLEEVAVGTDGDQGLQGTAKLLWKSKKKSKLIQIVIRTNAFFF